jgi:tRNA threonylcarbamoyl adenosine modification protein (Sua5/YciO/YrdC/YwlC family)
MAQYFTVHPVNPQPRLIRQAADIIRNGGVVAYPTDSCYALGCQIGDKAAMERIRWIRDIDESHHFTLMCRDLSEIGQYARVDNARFKLLKEATPGSYTFILEAQRDLPRRILHPKRRTIGIRIPDHPVARGLLAELNEPILSTTLILPGDDEPLTDPSQIRHRLEKAIELVIDAGPCGTEPTTVVDLTGQAPEIIRHGKGSVAPFLH